MTKVIEISKRYSPGTEKNSRKDLCSYLQTFDTKKPDNHEERWKNKARRKWYASILSYRLQKYELELCKKDRGTWNAKISYKYIEAKHDDGTPKINKYREPLYVKTNQERKTCTSYDHYNNIGNQRRWAKMARCMSEIKQVFDYTQSEKNVVYKATYKCNDKLCANCSQIRSLLAVTRYQKRVMAMHEPVMVVLHQKSPGIGKLKSTIDAMYNDWRSILKVTAKSKKEESFNGICALEVTTNENDKTYHPHYHIILEKLDAERLMGKWIAKDPINRTYFAHQHKDTGEIYSELPKDKNGNFQIKELFKYAMKMSVTNQDQTEKHKTIATVEMIYEIAKALKGVQQWRPFGDFRNELTQEEANKIIQDEMRINAYEFPHLLLSKAWKWKKYDWEAYDIHGLSLTGWQPTKGDIAFLRLNQREISIFTDE